MTNKKQIMIDGVDVSECEFYVHYDYDKFPHRCNLHKDMFGLPVCCDVADCCKNCYFKQLARKTRECEQKDKEINKLHLIIDRLLEASGYDKNISSAEDFEDVYADIDYKLGLLDELKQECQELKKANQHIDANRQRKGSKLKRIEELISACETGYTDEFIQKIYGIIQESEPAIDDYSITDRYRKALEEIESICLEDVHTFADGTELRYDSLDDILDIINNAKGEK